MLIFVASHRRKSLIKIEPDLGWSAFNSGDITCVPLGDTHFSALGRPEIATLAADRINAFVGHASDAFEERGLEANPAQARR